MYAAATVQIHQDTFAKFELSDIVTKDLVDVQHTSPTNAPDTFIST